jgi:hypothetical protein
MIEITHTYHTPKNSVLFLGLGFYDEITGHFVAYKD